jgi:hypothetical protein
MRFLTRLLAISILLPASFVMTVAKTEARPFPDRPGICYFFKNDSLDMTQSCVMSSGYGAGAQYVILNWTDGVRTAISTDTRKVPYTITVDNEPSEGYMRDASWYGITSNADSPDGVIYCQRILSNENSVCYKFTD